MSEATRAVRILNVDDYEPGRYSRTRVLRRAGFSVIEATNGTDALRMVRSDRPHVVLLDVNLPDISGFDVCQQIKADPDLADTLVLHFSATSVTVQAKLQGLQAGGDSYLAEPIDPDELIANVQALLRLRKAEEDLRGTNVMLRAIIDSSPLAVVAVDLQGLVRRWSAAAERIFGWSEEEVLGEPLPTVEPPERDSFLSLVSRVAAGHPTGPLERRPARRDGSRVDVSMSVAPLRDGEGHIDGMLALIEDITERKAAEREIARLYEQAQVANRTKDEFLATLSHELRTPLNAMLGWVRMLRRDEVPDERREHALGVIERNAMTQVRLIEDILDVSRIVSGKLRLRSERVDLRQVIEVVSDTMRPAAAEAGVALDVVLDVDGATAGQFTAMGDPQRLQQVVFNLLSNAVKFTPRGGRVDVALRIADGAAEVAVRDTGIGIEPAFLPFVFDRFRQANSSTTRAHGGLGLGLAIARHLVDAHGGRIAAASDGPGTGSTFTVTIPLRPLSSPQPADRDAGVVRPSLDGLHLLVVEDDEDSRVFIDDALTWRGARVTAVATVEETMRALATGRVDALVADIGLPDEDGYTLIRRVRAVPGLSGLPAIAVTGFASEDDRVRLTAAGYVAHLPKPCDPEALARTIARVARRD